MRLYLFLFSLCFATLIEGQRWDTQYPSSGGGWRGTIKGKPIGTNLVQAAAPSTPSVVTPQHHQIPAKAPIRAGGVGAWGYMAIILTVVLSGIGVYYVFLLYPVVCKKERMYDVMEMTAV